MSAINEAHVTRMVGAGGHTINDHGYSEACGKEVSTWSWASCVQVLGVAVHAVDDKGRAVFEQ